MCIINIFAEGIAISEFLNRFGVLSTFSFEQGLSAFQCPSNVFAGFELDARIVMIFCYLLQLYYLATVVDRKDSAGWCVKLQLAHCHMYCCLVVPEKISAVCAC